MDFDEEEISYEKGKMYAFIAFVLISIIVFGIVISIVFIKSIFKDFQTHEYYVLEIDAKNKETIISLLEKENLSYCETMYEIEYEQLFPNDKSATIYCKGGEEIKFSIYDGKKSELAQYIYENGTIEKR